MFEDKEQLTANQSLVFFPSRSRVYRIRVHEKAADAVLAEISAGEADGLFDVLKMARGSGDFTDVMVHQPGISVFRELIRRHKIASQVMDTDVER